MNDGIFSWLVGNNPHICLFEFNLVILQSCNLTSGYKRLAFMTLCMGGLLALRVKACTFKMKMMC